MRIYISNLVPKEWVVTDLGKNIQLGYKATKGKGPKSFIFPKKIIIDETFMEGLGLFLGDSDLNRKEKRHLSYCSKDKDIAKHALNFLQIYFLVNIKDVTFTVQYRKKNKNIEKGWSEFLNIPKNKVLTRFSNRHKEETMQIQVNGSVFRKLFETTIKKVLDKNFIQNKNFRRGILRGLFAAEGNIGIDYLEKKPYISQITFNLHINEIHIKDIICNILRMEKINFRTSVRKEYNTLEIHVSNWKNYWKFYQIKVFDLCDRKKNKFIKILEKLKVYCILEETTRDSFFNSLNLKQQEIAKLINSWQGNVSKTTKGIHNLTIEQLIILQTANQFPMNELKKGIKTLRIGSLTEIEDEEFMNFIFNLKINQ